MLLSSFKVPQLGCLVHGPGGTEALVRVEGHRDDLVLMPGKSVHKFACVSIPEFGGGVKAAGENLIAVLVGAYPKGTLKAMA